MGKKGKKGTDDDEDEADQLQTLLPAAPKNPPKWRKGWTYREYRGVLSSWAEKAQLSYRKSDFGLLLMQTTDESKIAKVCLRLQKAGFLEDWDRLLQ